jgi:septum site-determining protein MinD
METEASSWEKIITVYSPGGGTGKSEIAASLAYILAGKGKKIWLIDANLFAPSLDIIYNMNYDNCDTLTEFLLNDTLSQIPVCDISHVVKSHRGGRLYLTPCIRNDTEKRSQIERALIDEENTCEKIPEAIYRGLGQEIDLLIVDTHPGFERINQVWLGVTKYLLLVSRITDVDIENLKMLLKEKNLLDIWKKLIVFNNVRLDEDRNAFRPMDNDQMQARFLNLLQNPPSITGVHPGEGNTVEIFQHPITYSETLASFPSSKGLYIQSHPRSTFALIMKSLAEKIEHDLDIR